jgi:hypothetical protein
MSVGIWASSSSIFKRNCILESDNINYQKLLLSFNSSRWMLHKEITSEMYLLQWRVRVRALMNKYTPLYFKRIWYIVNYF